MLPDQYGNFYYCIKTELSESGEIYAYADTVTVENGALTMATEKGVKTLMIPHGDWSCCFAASVIDGACVSVEHWEGEYIEKV